jgi:photosystem II stability/assembly factor-like uncharacterized protein
MLFISLGIFPLTVAAEEPAVASSDSGWVDQTPDPGGEDLLSVSAVDADTAWAVGNYDILHTDDGGTTWTPQEMLNSYSWAVGAFDENKVWVVGSVDDLFQDNIQWSANGGDEWVRVNTGLDARAYLTDLAIPDVNTIWAVGSGDTIIKTTNGGWTWTLQNYIWPIMDEWLNGISALDSQTAWAVGSYGTILKTTDGGATWFEQDAGYALHSDVAAVDADTVWIVGGHENIFKTTDGGDTWVNQHSSTPGSLSSIAAVDAYTAWAVGSWEMLSSEVYNVILKTTDGGETWVPQDAGTELPLYDIVALDACTAWAVGKDGVIIKTTDGGDDKPDIKSISPTSGQPGIEVAVVGCDFGDIQGDSHVSFGDVEATSYSSWSDGEITVTVPEGICDGAEVTVTTPAGTSNPVLFSCFSVTSITPDQAAQNAVTVNITDLAGTGFEPGATVRFEQGERVLEAYDVNVVSDTQITCKIGFFMEPVGAYDVVVVNPDSSEARLEEGFTVNSPCGEGGGMAVMLLGITLGLLSLAGGSRLRRKR